MTNGVRLLCPVAYSRSCRCCSWLSAASWFKLQYDGAILVKAAFKSVVETSPMTCHDREKSSDVVAFTRSVSFLTLPASGMARLRSPRYLPNLKCMPCWMNHFASSLGNRGLHSQKAHDIRRNTTAWDGCKMHAWHRPGPWCKARDRSRSGNCRRQSWRQRRSRRRRSCHTSPRWLTWWWHLGNHDTRVSLRKSAGPAQCGLSKRGCDKAQGGT